MDEDSQYIFASISTGVMISVLITTFTPLANLEAPKSFVLLILLSIVFSLITMLFVAVVKK